MYFCRAVIADYFESINSPRKLQPGTLIVRVLRGGERVYEEWTVIGWQTPEKPAAGQPWSSGFLVCKDSDGERRSFGPSRLVITDFRLPERVAQASNTKPRRGHWWDDRD